MRFTIGPMGNDVPHHLVAERYELPKFFSGSSFKSKIANGWAITGLTVTQSGQPYSVVDYSGAVGSIFYGVNDGITNPIVPLAANCSPQKAVTGLRVRVPLLRSMRPASLYRC